MIASDKVTRRFVLLMAGSALLAVGGCGEDEKKTLRRRYPVSGKVTYKGNPLESGEISFHPDGAGGKPATGTITDGSYSLTTLTPGDGAYPGNYKVVITPKLTLPVKGKTAKPSPAIPQKYGLDTSSGLTAEVQPQTNNISFELKD
ncbi:MAG TPA: hypothetical protein VGY53_03895 [Isosphaeraceae bacterium]|nr:hypothetical protein [Isosphaeraceae bacterium]